MKFLFTAAAALPLMLAACDAPPPGEPAPGELPAPEPGENDDPMLDDPDDDSDPGDDI